MQEKLGTFEGRDVQASELRLLGSSRERVGQLELDEEVLIVAKATVSQVNYRNKALDRGGEAAFVRTHRAGITQFYVVPVDQGARWLEEARQLADERFGIQDLLSWTDDQNGGGDESGGDDQA